MAEEPSDPQIVARLKNLPPYEDEKPPEEQVVDTEVEETQEQPVEEVTEVVEETKPEETEEERKKRTAEEFEKLKKHNDELKKALEEKTLPKKNALDALIPESPITNVVPTTKEYPDLAPKEIKDAFANLTDDQGYVDTGLLKETLLDLQKAKVDAEKRASEAETLAKQTARRQDDFERKQIMKEVHAAFPKLDPENANNPDPEKRFDQRFYDLFQDKIMGQWGRTGTADPLKTARDASDILYPGMTKADKEKQAAAELAKKNINASKVTPASTHETYKDRDELIRATRAGSHNAIMERLNRIGQ